MAHIRSIPGQDFGFDGSNNTQVIPLSGIVTVLLIAGGDTKVSIDDENKVELVGGAQTTDVKDAKMPWLTEWEQQYVQRITMRGRAAGQTLLRARLADGRDWILPLRLVVRPNNLFSQTDGRTVIGAALVDDIKGMSLHDAAVRIAQDQLHSKQRTMGGDGYGAVGGEDWCGIFAIWCWEQAAKALSKTNPFGDKDHLKSPQKAINWALVNTNFRVFNVTVATSIGGYAKPPSATVKLLEPSEATPVLPGDIMIERHRTPKDKDGKDRNFFTQWKHVAIVTSKITAPSGTFTTIEGNQGFPETIKAYEHDLSEKITYGTTGDVKSRFAFVSYVE